MEYIALDLLQATNDLEKVDQARKKDFKTYEMTKEHMRREKLKMMSERERKEAEAKQAELKQKHKDHPKLHHPVSIGLFQTTPPYKY